MRAIQEIERSIRRLESDRTEIDEAITHLRKALGLLNRSNGDGRKQKSVAHFGEPKYKLPAHKLVRALLKKTPSPVGIPQILKSLARSKYRFSRPTVENAIERLLDEGKVVRTRATTGRYKWLYTVRQPELHEKEDAS